MSDTGLQYPMELLQQIVAGLNKQDPRTKLGCLEVDLLNSQRQVFTFSVPQVLDAIANDLYWDERGNWADARIAVVRTY